MLKLNSTIRELWLKCYLSGKKDNGRLVETWRDVVVSKLLVGKSKFNEEWRDHFLPDFHLYLSLTCFFHQNFPITYNIKNFITTPCCIISIYKKIKTKTKNKDI